MSTGRREPTGVCRCRTVASFAPPDAVAHTEGVIEVSLDTWASLVVVVAAMTGLYAALRREVRAESTRVRDELRHEMREGFGHVDQRFTAVDQRFEQVDRRFEQVDKRFDQVDKRFEQVDKRFDLVDQRFEQVDNRFDLVDKRLEQVDERFARVDERFVRVEESIVKLDDRVYALAVGLRPILEDAQKPA